MIPVFPVFEQGKGEGIGITVDALANKIVSYPRGDRVALLLRDFKSRRLQTLFREHRVFVVLDRLLGEQFHLFYAHGPALNLASNVLGLDAPSILLATSDGVGGFTNVEFKTLQQDHDALAVMELANVIRDYRDHIVTSRSGWVTRLIGNLPSNVSANLIANGLAALF